MAKKISSEDKITDTTLHELLLMMDARLKHIEDMSADNRAIIIKLVKQNNSIVEFLKSLELEIIEGSEFGHAPVEIKNDKLSKLMTLVEQFKESNEEFKKFLKEIEEFKDDITPGQFGES